MRFPTEDTPPNHRRLAENDTLVELIQTAEYLEDAPSWEQRRFYPLQYGDPYYRGCGRGCGGGRGRGRGCPLPNQLPNTFPLLRPTVTPKTNYFPHILIA